MTFGKIAALGLGAAMMMVGGAAEALPVAPALQAGRVVDTVADRCGPGFYRGPRGFCRPMPMGRRFFAPPPRRYPPPAGRAYPRY